MKTKLLITLAAVVVLSVTLSLADGTIATWSDSEMMMNNFIVTGSVDLLVAKCDADWENPGAFKDDLPYGVGLDPCFVASLMPGNYTCYSLLWNAGFADAVAYLHIKNVIDSSALSSHTCMSIWYDHDGRPDTSLVLVASDTIANLDCHEIELGSLPGQVVRQLKLELEYDGPCPTRSLSFDLVFALASDGFGFGDSEISQNHFSAPE
jgi:hypothetical protein